ncbi:hypothetical protein Goari_018955, partial [Gossypium aridum]|nr:hypothetical protein [Gossypium aridum]
TFKIQTLFVSFILGANPGFQVERKLEVDDSSEVLQIMQMQAIGELDKYMGLDFFAFSVIRYLIIFNQFCLIFLL